MGFPFGKVFSVASRIAVAVATGAPVVETFATSIGAAKSGDQKKAAILSLVQQELEIASATSGHDLTHDGDVLAATGGVIDAFVALENIIQKKTAPAAPAAPAPATSGA